MASPQSIKLPKTAVSMISPRDYRLSSLNGYCIVFKAGVPENVPPHIYEEALQCGAYLAEGESVDKAAPAAKPTIDPSIAEAAKLAAEANTEALETALTIIITRNTPEDFKADGTPKVSRVVAEMDPMFARPNATQVADAYERLQENIDLVED